MLGCTNCTMGMWGTGGTTLTLIGLASGVSGRNGSGCKRCGGGALITTALGVLDVLAMQFGVHGASPMKAPWVVMLCPCGWTGSNAGARNSLEDAGAMGT